MLKDKVLALVKSLHQRPRSRLLPLPEYAPVRGPPPPSATAA
jgi:hypothetical protein